MAASAVLAAYNWAPRTDRHRCLALFVEAFFSKIKALQRPPFHPKWQEVALNAPLAGWTRFPPAQEWINRNKAAAPPESFNQFEQFLSDNQVRSVGLDRSDGREALFRQFLDWQRQQPAAAR